MRTRTALIVAAVALVGAALALISRIGGEDAGGTTPTRAISLDVDASGRAFAVLEQLHDGQWRPAVAHVRGSATLDTSAADLPLEHPAAVVAQSDQRLFVAGERVVDGRRRLAVTRIDSNGRVDRTFGTGGVATFAVGDGDAAVRGLAWHPATGIVLVGDATDGDAHAMAIVRTGDDGRDPRVDLVRDATAGGADAVASGALAAGTDTGDGSTVLVRLPRDGRPRVTRARTRLTSATWRAVAASQDGGAAIVGSGRDRDARSVVAVQRFTPSGAPSAPQAIPVGQGDAYGAAVRMARAGRVVVGANGVERDRPAAFVVILDPQSRVSDAGRRASGRVAGVTAGGALLTTRWDGRRQTVAFTP